MGINVEAGQSSILEVEDVGWGEGEGVMQLGQHLLLNI